MCGIAGYMSIGGCSENRLAEALTTLSHRGPDHAGTAFFQWSDIEVALGSTRLSIIDRSPAGHMPMCTAEGTCSIVFNGEIYDAPVHRKELEARGARFQSRTDTEVLLHGLALDGPAFLDRIDGMYAVAFWDTREPVGLLLARDRFGEKPLFIAENGGSVSFASELPALLQLLGHTPEVDPAALRHVLQWGYPPNCDSIFRGVRKLRPGTWEWFGRRAGAGALVPLQTHSEIEAARDVRTAAALIRDNLYKSVQDRMVADVPVGVFLSGGLDSAGVAAMAARCLKPGERLNTYTVGYPGADVSELQPARRFSDWLGTQHQEIILGPESLTALAWVAASLGEPVGDPAALPTYFLSAFSRRTSTVLLTGEGADELFFGYPRYLWHDVAQGQLHGSFAARAAGAIAGHLIKRVRSAPSDAADRDSNWKGMRWPLTDLLASGVQEALDCHNKPTSSTPAAHSSRADDLVRWLPESVLVRVDRMTMAASIESRAPFLAREVARLGLHLPDGVLRRFPFGKFALRAALKDYVPFLKCWGVKRPFAVPLIEWLTGPLRLLFDDVFFGERLLARGWFKRDGLRALGHAVLLRDPGGARMAWTVLTLELWARAHLDGEVPAKPEWDQVTSPKLYPKGTRREHLLLTLDFPPGIGGIQLFNGEVWRYGGLGDVTVIAGRTRGDQAFDATFPGRVVRLPRANGLIGRVQYLIGVAGALTSNLLQKRAIHVAHVALAPAVLPLCYATHLPVVVWTYALELTNPRFSGAIRRLLERADRVVVISEYSRHLAIDRGARPDSIVKIWPGGDDLRVRYRSADPDRFRVAVGASREEFLILSVGRMSPFDGYKGFDRAIEVASLMVEHRRPFRWVVIGGGPDVSMYRARVIDAGLQNHMSFIGGVDDPTIADAYSACDMFCLFSREEETSRGTLAEGFGIVHVQAGSFGKPVIGLRRGGVPDAVLDGETGILVDEDTARVIAQQVEALMDSPAERQRLGNNGLKHALGDRSWSAARRRVKQMLDGL